MLTMYFSKTKLLNFCQRNISYHDFHKKLIKRVKKRDTLFDTNGHETSTFICMPRLFFQINKNCKLCIMLITLIFSQFSQYLNANVFAQKSFRRTCPGFDPVTPLQ